MELIYDKGNGTSLRLMLGRISIEEPYPPTIFRRMLRIRGMPRNSFQE